MLMGIRLLSSPSPQQKLKLSQWLGCARVIWNGKCQEHKVHQALARQLNMTGFQAPIDQKYSQFKDKELTPWLYDCPSQLLRNSAVNWYNTFQNHLKGRCGKPKHKKKHDNISLHLTSELFSFDKCPSTGAWRLFIGTKRNHIGYLQVNYHTDQFNLPKSIRIKKKNGRYWVSFCYEDGLDSSALLDQHQHLEKLRELDPHKLEGRVEAVDCGVAIMAQTTKASYDFTPEQERSIARQDKKKKKLQKAMARGKKGSKRREKKKRRMARASEKVGNIRRDCHHKISKQLVQDADVIVFEDLRVKQMTKRPKVKRNEKTGRAEANGARAKAGLNRAILMAGWHMLYSFTKYKAFRAGKVTYKVRAHFSSQECADCHHTHPDNRASQANFVCQKCGHQDNADRNAARVLKGRAISLILDSGTELSGRGVLLSDKGRGAAYQTQEANVSCASLKEASKMREASASRSSVL